MTGPSLLEGWQSTEFLLQRGVGPLALELNGGTVRRASSLAMAVGGRCRCSCKCIVLGHGKVLCFLPSTWVTVGCWWEPVQADPRFPGSDEWELQSSVLPLRTWSSGARHFPICSVHMRYGFKTPWGLACIWSLLLAKKPLSPLNSKLYKEPCEAEESRDRSRRSPCQPCLPCRSTLLHPGSLPLLGIWQSPSLPGTEQGFCWCCVTT